MKILTLTGPSCSGKTSLLNELVANHGFQSIISHTTRPMRPGEIDGKDYYFVSDDYFDNMLVYNKFIESITFNGFSYGVSLSEIVKAHESGKTAVLIVEPNGLIQVLKYAEKHKDIEVKSVYISGNIYELIERYLGRLAGEDLSAEGVAKRHARRIQSMIEERTQWMPDDTDYSGFLKVSSLTNNDFSVIPYAIKLKHLDENNFETTIKQINEMEFNK